MNAACTLIYNLPADKNYVRLKGLVGYDSSCDTDAPSGGSNCTMKFLIYTTSSKTVVTADLTTLGYDAEEEVSVKDCWSGEELPSVKGTLSAEVGNHGARLLKISAPQNPSVIQTVPSQGDADVTKANGGSSSNIYDLTGRKLTKEPQKGFFIKDGKKSYR